MVSYSWHAAPRHPKVRSPPPFRRPRGPDFPPLFQQPLARVTGITAARVDGQHAQWKYRLRPFS
nr:MAG TPA: hypothetical protein [Caudoviricetes sp.]